MKYNLFYRKNILLNAFNNKKIINKVNIFQEFSHEEKHFLQNECCKWTLKLNSSSSVFFRRILIYVCLQINFSWVVPKVLAYLVELVNLLPHVFFNHIKLCLYIYIYIYIYIKWIDWSLLTMFTMDTPGNTQ